MRDFLFEPEQARTPIGKLSGGERGRLMLARALRRAVQPAGARRADQRSRHRDARRVAGDAGDYPGTILVVSHDRDFLDRIATSVLFAEGDGTWTEYAGGYSDMVRQRGEGIVAAPAPKATEAEAEARAGGSAQAQAFVQGSARAGWFAGTNRGCCGETRRAGGEDG